MYVCACAYVRVCSSMHAYMHTVDYLAKRRQGLVDGGRLYQSLSSGSTSGDSLRAGQVQQHETTMRSGLGYTIHSINVQLEHQMGTGAGKRHAASSNSTIVLLGLCLESIIDFFFFFFDSEENVINSKARKRPKTKPRTYAITSIINTLF